MSSRQRLAAVIALVVLLVAAGYALVPFRPEGASRACGPAVLDAFRSVPSVSSLEDLAARPGGLQCPGPARTRLGFSSVVAVLAVFGGLASIRILEEPSPPA